MNRKIIAFIALLLITTNTFAQNSAHTADEKNKWQKPYNNSYYNILLGYVNASGPVREGTYGACWGQARTSFLNYMITRLPRHKFQIRDAVDLQLGVGTGKGLSQKKNTSFYGNLVIAAGLKFKYDISQKIDFGFHVFYRAGIDKIPYSAPMIDFFARYDRFFAEFGTGGNGDITPVDKQRRLKNINFKYYLKPDNPHTWSINVSYWNIMGRNNQINNAWETCNQLMLGIGRQF